AADVDRDPLVARRVRAWAPRQRVLARGLQGPAADRHDEAALLGERDELRGADEAVLVVVPAAERLEAEHLAGLERDHRLVVEAQLGALERAAQVGLEEQAADRLGAHAL